MPPSGPDAAVGSDPSGAADGRRWQGYDPWAPPESGPGPGAALPTPRGRAPGRGALVLGALLLALVSGAVGGAVGSYAERNAVLTEVELPQAPPDDRGRAPGSIAGIAGAALPGVVTLRATGGGEQGTGTGFVLDQRGHILTNNHVVAPAGSGGEIQVTFHGGRTAPARVVGADSGYDLAVVRVTGVRGLTALPLGNSDSVRVGDPVVAIGAPFELSGTVTTGIISAKERPITAGGAEPGTEVSYVNALQTDAPINPGNSGGPLVDTAGRVIGINSAIRSPGSEPGAGDAERSGSVGVGFAIPINQGRRVAEELINHGRATHPVLGLRLDARYSGRGARVADPGGKAPAVTPGGPGDRAGIEEGDIITEVNGTPIPGNEELIVVVRSHRPGDRLTLTVRRSGRTEAVSVVLGSASGN